MEALVITEVGKAEMRQTEVPVPGRAEVRLAVRYVGLCGSDMNTFTGLNPLVQLPRIPGHEISAVVESVGPDVPAEFVVGTPVIVNPYTACGACSSCRAGRGNACRDNQTLGVQRDGGMSNRIVIPHDKLIINHTLADRHLALVEPLAVGFHAVGRGRITASDTVVVLGGGMIGVAAMLGARAAGARVIAVEIEEEKHETLLALGVEAVIDPLVTDLEPRVNELTDGSGPDVVIEAIGLPQTFREAVDLVCFAGRVVYIGYAKAEVSYDTTLFNLKELDILGSRNATREDFDAVIAFLGEKRDIADRLVSRVFDWADATTAFDYWKDNRGTIFKVMVEMAEDR